MEEYFDRLFLGIEVSKIGEYTLFKKDNKIFAYHVNNGYMLNNSFFMDYKIMFDAKKAINTSISQLSNYLKEFIISKGYLKDFDYVTLIDINSSFDDKALSLEIDKLKKYTKNLEDILACKK